MSTGREEYSVTWAGELIGFQLRRSERRTLGITVRPDTSVLVTAPKTAPLEKIYTKVSKRAHWIRRQQAFFREFLPKTPPRLYVSGETHRYLGRQYRLKVIEGPERSVKLKGRFIWVQVRKKGSAMEARELLEEWYLNRAKERLQGSLLGCVARMGKRLPTPPRMRVRRMPKRWGSWTPRGGISLNPELIKAPGSCLDYVVMHELCHAVHGNHDKEFYALLRQMMPDWEKRKARLEKALVS